MSHACKKNDESIGTLTVYFGDSEESGLASWHIIDANVRDMVSALNAKGLPRTYISGIPDTIFMSRGGPLGDGRSLGTRSCWKTPGIEVNEELLEVFETVFHVVTIEYKLWRKGDGAIGVIYARRMPKQRQEIFEKSFRQALEHLGLLDDTARVRC